MTRGIAAAIAVGLVVLAVVLGSWYTVDQTERGVLLRNGAVIGTAQPGLGFKVPLIDGVEKISVRTITYTWDKMNSYSFDQQPADLKISVTLRASPDKMSDLYAKFGRLDTGQPGRQSGRAAAGQGRVRPLYRGKSHPGARSAQ
jgi:regulator of protease activity HflC (stomatin/prohibitin superfamily)